MRDILFRGKRVDNCEWEFGFLVKWKTWSDLNEKWTIRYGIVSTEWCNMQPNDCIEVVPETVGQYVGLKDKNEKRIFDGDIVSGENYLFPTYDNRKLNIYFDKESCGFRMNVFKLETLEVVGNIHDNPELLEK